jgi:hypothetical protein
VWEDSTSSDFSCLSLITPTPFHLVPPSSRFHPKNKKRRKKTLSLFFIFIFIFICILYLKLYLCSEHCGKRVSFFGFKNWISRLFLSFCTITVRAGTTWPTHKQRRMFWGSGKLGSGEVYMYFLHNVNFSSSRFKFTFLIFEPDPTATGAGLWISSQCHLLSLTLAFSVRTSHCTMFLIPFHPSSHIGRRIFLWCITY